jgi:DNA-binding NarL/FixJ family response regulator
MIELLEITPEEERQPNTIISGDERRRRDRGRKKRQRREAGEVEMTRQEYLTRAVRRRAQARRLAQGGKSLRQIAKELGISHEAVRKALLDR